MLPDAMKGVTMNPENGLLIAERHARFERHVLVRRRDEPAIDDRSIGQVPLVPAQLFVLVSSAARAEPSLATALPAVLTALPELTPSIESIWLGAAGLGAEPELALRLAKELDSVVVAPDGGFTVAPGAGLYAGYGEGGRGWHEFSPNRPTRFLGARFPQPAWESWLPDSSVEAADAVVEAVPCGLLVHSADVDSAAVKALAFRVGVDPRFPKIVVGGAGSVPSPAAVAEVMNRLSSERVLVVPGSGAAATNAWQVELALRVGRDIVFSTGVQTGADGDLSSTVVVDLAGEPLFRPFATVLRQPAGAGDQQVLDVAAAPAGWERNGRRSYRLADDGRVVADVVPAGLVLRPADAGRIDSSAAAAPFDPSAWSLTLGVTGEVVSLPVLAAAEGLLARMEPRQREVVRVRVAGLLDDQADAALNQWTGPAEKRSVHSPAPHPTPPSRQEASAPPGSPGRPRRITADAPPASPSPATAEAIVTTSTAPVSTVSGSAQSTWPKREHEPPEDAGSEAVDTANVEPELTSGTSSTSGEAFPPRPTVVPPAAISEPLSRPRAVPDRVSTSAEQARFTAAAGESFGEALALVNAALATWPSMRAEESAGAKADYVAVCLYLGRGEASAALVTAAVRAGRVAPLDGQVPCLVSGIRRLATHRRAVLRQGKLGESIEHRSDPGTLLTEPGFLTASMDLDVTAAGADLDVLIWPVMARRTTELLLNRPVGEAVFPAGSRFKALAVRTAEERDSEEGEGLSAPKVAALFRELAPGESPSGTELDERDLAVLAKLDHVLARRQETPLRLVEDAAVAARLTTSLVVWHDNSEGTGPAAVAS